MKGLTGPHILQATLRDLRREPDGPLAATPMRSNSSSGVASWIAPDWGQSG